MKLCKNAEEFLTQYDKRIFVVCTCAGIVIQKMPNGGLFIGTATAVCDDDEEYCDKCRACLDSRPS